jgi:phosphoenolpyruvate synthase/pyruvate phosphate dikinase
MANTVCTFDQLTLEQSSAAGGKGGILARLYQAGYPVPDGLVVLSGAFAGEELSPTAWAQVQAHLTRLRAGDPQAAFAVRSSALGEDSARASFAGEFETVLDVRTDAEVRAAIHAVRRSRHSKRVQAYVEARGLEADPARTADVNTSPERILRMAHPGLVRSAGSCCHYLVYLARSLVCAG